MRRMIWVLRKHYGISVTLRDFTTSPDERGSFTTFPLEFARISDYSEPGMMTRVLMWFLGSAGHRLTPLSQAAE